MTEFFQLAGGLFVSFFALIVIVIGAVLISLGLFTLQRHRAAAGWPQAPGVIEVSEVAAEHHFEENLMYRPVIRYRYNAPGGPYTSDKLSSTASSTARSGKRARSPIAIRSAARS
jgi:hypothetical protein